MPIKFQCPKCQRGLTVKDELAGKRGPCPHCKTVVTVPAASTAPARPAAGAPGASPPAAPAAPAAPPARKPANPARPAGRPAPAAARTAPAPPPPPHPGPPPQGGREKEEGPAPAAAEPPAKTAEELEAEAAALLGDEPAREVEPEVKTIDFQCPYCDEQVQMPLELAGKKSPCPSCRRVIKVPEPANKGPKDWRQVDTRLPLGARRPDEPTPEGAWGTREVGRASAEALKEAGVIKVPAAPRTTWQKIRLPLAGATLLIVAVVATFSILAWRAGRRQQQALDQALTYAGSPEAAKQIRPAGQGALHTYAGEYFLRQQKPGCATEAGKQFGQARQVLRSSTGSERDLVLTELALKQIDMVGSDEDALQQMRLKWNDVMRELRASLESIESSDGRLEALRQVCSRLMAVGQGDRVVPLVSQLYSANDASRAEALSVAGLLLLAGGERKQAERAAEQALSLYPADKKPKTGGTAAPKTPSLRAAVVTLALALKKEPPAGKKKEPGQEEERHIGEAGGLARQGQWEQARHKAAKEAEAYSLKVQLRALLAVAAAAVDEKAGSGDVEAAVQMVVQNAAALQNEPDRAERDRIAWQLLRLTRLGLRAGLKAEDLTRVAGVIADPGLRGWAQLELLRPRLDPSGSGADEAAVDQVEKGAVAHQLARLFLARFQTRQDAGWAKTVQGWEEPARAFGSLGVALGLEDRDKGT